VVPVHQAGSPALEDGYDIDANLRLEPAPAIPLGRRLLWLRSGTDRAVCSSEICCTAAANPRARPVPVPRRGRGRRGASRHRCFDAVATDNALMLPAHFPGAGAVEVRRDGAGYAFTEWAAAQ